jgi:hypothetical protein
MRFSGDFCAETADAARSSRAAGSDFMPQDSRRHHSADLRLLFTHLFALLFHYKVVKMVSPSERAGNLVSYDVQFGYLDRPTSY